MKKIVFCLCFLWIAFSAPQAIAQGNVRFGIQTSPTFTWMNTSDADVNRSGTNLGLRLAMMSVADTVIIPLQDILGLGKDARLNTPGNTQDNWQWRLPGKKLTKHHAAWLKKTTATYGRCRG